MFHRKLKNCFNHLLDLVLTYGLEPDHLLMAPLNPLPLDHYLIMFEFNILDATMENEQCHYSRCLSESAVNTFKEVIISHLPLIEYGGATESDDLKVTSADVDYLVNQGNNIFYIQPWMLLLL